MLTRITLECNAFFRPDALVFRSSPHSRTRLRPQACSPGRAQMEEPIDQRVELRGFHHVEADRVVPHEHDPSLVAPIVPRVAPELRPMRGT